MAEQNTEAAILTACKHALRLSSSTHDSEVTGLIDACYEELSLAGVNFVGNRVNPPAIIRQAIILYCKAEFGLNNPDSEKYKESFLEAKKRLAISTRYGGNVSAAGGEFVNVL